MRQKCTNTVQTDRQITNTDIQTNKQTDGHTSTLTNIQSYCITLIAPPISSQFQTVWSLVVSTKVSLIMVCTAESSFSCSISKQYISLTSQWPLLLIKHSLNLSQLLLTLDNASTMLQLIKIALTYYFHIHLHKGLCNM